MHPVIFHLFGNISIKAYGLMIAIAFIVSIFAARKLAGDEDLPKDKFVDLGFWVIISAIVGSRLLFVLMNLERFSFIDALKIWDGGLTFYGGFILALGVGLLFFRLNKINIWRGADIIGVVLPLGYAITRIGCFLNGCCYGKPTDLPWGMTFPPESAAGSHYIGTPIHPVQLYASLISIVFFLILFWAYRRKKFHGQIIWGYIFLYSIYRFFIEFIRGDKTPMVWNLTSMQYFSIVLFIISIVAYLELRRKRIVE